MRRGWLLALACAACASEPPLGALPVERAPLVVEAGPLAWQLGLTGELDAVDSIDLDVPRTDVWQLSVRWIAEDGAAVKQGDRLLEFDNSAVVSRLTELESAVIRASDELAAQVSRDELAIADKELEVERQRVTRDKAALDAAVPRSLVARRDFQEFQLALERAESALATAESELEAARTAARLEREVKQIDYDKALRTYEHAREQLDALELRAPRDGLLIVAEHPWFGRKLQVGDTVQPGMAAVRVSATARMQVKARLSDVDDGRIHPGARATCVLDAYPGRSFPGVIESIAEIAQQPGEGSTRRFFTVIVALEESDNSIMQPGMSVRVDVAAGTDDRGPVAPRAGLDLDASPPRARLADGSERPVQLGACSAQACVVLDGLRPGERLRYADPDADDRANEASGPRAAVAAPVERAGGDT